MVVLDEWFWCFDEVVDDKGGVVVVMEVGGNRDGIVILTVVEEGCHVFFCVVTVVFSKCERKVLGHLHASMLHAAPYPART